MPAPPRQEIVDRVSGILGWRPSRAGLADAPFVRRVQRKQLLTSLPWVRRALGLALPTP